MGGRDRARQVGVIRVQICEDAAARPLESFIDGVGGASILSGMEVKAPTILFENPQRIVARSAVHHDIFDIRVVLRQNAFDGLFQISAHVVARSDDTDQRDGVHVFLSSLKPELDTP